MDEALGAKAGEQALGDALLEVQVDGVVREYPCVLEDHGPDRRLPAPVGELLVVLPGRPQRVERSGPARIGRYAPVERRKHVGPAAVLIRRLGKRLGTEDLQRAGEG